MAAATRSQAERLWLAGGGLLAFLLLVIGYFFFVGPQRSQTSTVDASLAAARHQNSALETRITALRLQNKNVSTVRTRLAAAQQALPSSSGISDFLRTLQKLGGSTSTRVVSLTVGAPTDVTAIAAGTTPGPAPAGAGASSTPSATPPTTTSTPPAGAAPGVATGPSVYGLTISAQVAGSPAALNAFLRQLQGVQPRAVLITQLTEGSGTNATSAGSASSGTTLQLTMQAFVAPGTASESANLAAATGH